MKKFGLIAVLALGSVTAAHADNLIWQSKNPTGSVTVLRGATSTSLPCYATLRKEAGVRVYRAVDCPSAPEMSDIGMAGPCVIRAACEGEAHHAKVLPGGKIKLY